MNDLTWHRGEAERPVVLSWPNYKEKEIWIPSAFLAFLPFNIAPLKFGFQMVFLCLVVLSINLTVNASLFMFIIFFVVHSQIKLICSNILSFSSLEKLHYRMNVMISLDCNT